MVDDNSAIPDLSLRHPRLLRCLPLRDEFKRRMCRFSGSRSTIAVGRQPRSHNGALDLSQARAM